MGNIHWELYKKLIAQTGTNTDSLSGGEIARKVTYSEQFDGAGEKKGRL